MRIGVHPNNLHLLLASRWPGGLGAPYSFVAYPEGRDSAALLQAGTIDLCGTGSTPPILAEAAGLGVRVLAASAMRPANGSIVVAAGSPITGIAQLKGRRVALLDGSFHTYLLARALDQAGLRLPDVERVELAPAASQRALAAGKVDAWVAMAPLLGSAMQAGAVRVLAANDGLIPNRSIFWTLAERRIDPAALAQVTADLVSFGATVAADPAQAARLLADARATDADLLAWQNAVSAREWTILPASAEILAEQAQEAGTLRRHGALGPVQAAA